MNISPLPFSLKKKKKLNKWFYIRISYTFQQNFAHADN